MKNKIISAITICLLIILSFSGCRSVDSNQTVSSIAPSSSEIISPDKSQSHIKKSEIIAEIEHNGQALTFEYIELDCVYPWDMRHVQFVNGYASVYYYGSNGVCDWDNSGFNAIDQYGNLLFDKTFAYLSNFNADGLAVAQNKDDGANCVVNTKGEITDINPDSVKAPVSNNDEKTPVLADMTDVTATSGVCNGLIAFVKNGKLGFADSEGNILVETNIGIEFREMIEQLVFSENIIAFEPADDLEYSPIAMIKVH